VGAGSGQPAANRVALSNDRISSLHNGDVTFAYRDRKNQDRRKWMTLEAEEFIRRFLLHVIPKGFIRVRHYGFLANHRKDCLSMCCRWQGYHLLRPHRRLGRSPHAA